MDRVLDLFFQLLKFRCFIFNCVCGVVWCDMCVGACGSQKRELVHLEMEFQGVVSYLLWILRTEYTFSSRAVRTLNH